MKTNVLIIAAIMIFSLNTQAQSEEYRSTISVNAGLSLAGALFNLTDAVTDDDNFRVNTLPALQVNYDHGINKWFSIGGGASYQTMVIETKPDEGPVNRARVNRTNVGIRPLFHYGNSDKLDMYSGVRLSYLNTGLKVVDGESGEFEDIDLGLLSGFRAQLVAFGIRGYFNEHIGLNMEVAIGAPHYLSGGINYRF